MSEALRAVYDIRGGAEKPVAAQILDLLLADPKDLAALDEASVRRLAGQVSKDAAAQPLGFAEDPFDQVLEHIHTLNAERGSEAAIIRLFESAAGGASVPDAIWNQLCPAAGPATPEERQEALVTVLGAWQSFLAQLNGNFNGAEAVRRSSSADFAQALVTFYLANDTEGGNAAGAQIVAHARAADYFATRLLGASAPPHCFDGLAGTLPRLQPDGAKLDAAGVEAIRAGLSAFYDEAIAPIAMLDPASVRFVADMAPHPLPIQISAQADADDLDAFATDFNGIGLAIRRLDRLAGVPDRWAHAQLASFDLYEAKPEKAEAAAPQPEGIRQWMPPPPDGRAPIFLDYNGFPLASQAATSAGSDPAAAQLYRRPPFYAADVTSPDGFAPIPRLAYGRRFEAFSFATTNAGSLPLALQKSADEPWLPSADFGPSAAAVYEACYQRRTAVGAVSIDEAADARKIGSAIAGVRPLSSDYPRTALLSSNLAPGIVDLMAEADGAGTLFFSAEAGDASILVDLTDVDWSGAARRLTLQFFDQAAEPGATTEFEIVFDGVSADAFSTDPRISIWLDSTAVPAAGGAPATVERTFRAKVGWVEQPPSPLVPTAGGWWVRIILDQGELASLSFAEPRSNSDPARHAAPLLLLAPPEADEAKSQWLDGLVTRHSAAIRAPRVGYLDFERWSANADNLAAMFPDAAAGRVLLADLLQLYVTRGAKPEAPLPSEVDVNAVRAQDALSMLPDPAVSALLVELICIDSLTGDKTAVAPCHIPLHDILRQIAEEHRKETEASGRPKARAMLLNRIDRAFSFELVIESLTSKAEPALPPPTKGPVTIGVPAGTVAELRVSPVVADAHFQELGGHPAVIHKGIRHMARRMLAPGMLAYPSASIRIETMLDDLVPGDRAQDLVDAMIACRPIDRARRYDIVVLGSASPGHRRDWRLLGKIAISTQRWRPSGRPIYNHVDPSQYVHVPAGRRPGPQAHAALQLQLPPDPDSNQGLSLFEAEAFFARRDGDAETIPYDLPPVVAPPASRVGIEPAATALQDIAWDPSSATYFRHRFELQSRYAGALPRPRRSIPAWNAAKDMEDTPHAWSMRVAILADGIRIDLTRPQLRALMPLTTAPDQEAERMDAAPPVLAYLQEPPFTGGGLADRIAAEIKTGFGYGFGPGPEVGILDARKEIGPDPRLSYRAMSKTRALGMALRVEGPIGLTFDAPDVTAPRFANASVSLSPVRVAGPAAASMEEHFLGVSLRRYLDPAWVAPSGETQAPTISQTQWLEFDPAIVADNAVLLSYAGHARHELIAITVEDDVRYVTAATAEIDAGGANTGELSVRITALAADSGRLAILHGGTVPGRYSASIFAVDSEGGVDVASGRSNQPLLLASFEWSPVVERIKDDNDDSKKPVPFRLVPLAGATTRPTVSSAPTFMAWTRTSRDFERTWMARVETHEGLDQFFAIQVDCNALSARFGGGKDTTTLSIGREDAETSGEWLCPSTFATEHPIHVHRHLAVLGSRYAAGKGRPMEVFAGAELAGALQIQIPSNSPLLVASSVRIVEFETPAAIVCAAPAVVPEVYRAAYLDLLASGGTPDRALKLFIRFVRPVSYVSKFTELQIRLSGVDDADGAEAEDFAEITLTDLADAAGLEINILGPKVTATRVSARGVKKNLEASAIFGNLALAANSPGFLVKLAAKGGPGEFWADISLLHSAPPTGQQSPDRFDFHWLFSAADADPAAAVKPSALAAMEEAQARIISVSPPIRVL